MIKQQFKNVAFLVIALLGLELLQCTPDDGGKYAGGSSTETIGKLVDEHGIVQKDATVLLFVADTQNNIVDSTFTDGNGDYKFDSLPTGNYTIIGYSKTEQKSVYIEPFEYDALTQKSLDTPFDNGTDTVRAPGSIEGCVSYSQIDQTGKDVIVYIPGTSYMVTTDNGEFTMSSVPKGSYTLKFDRVNFVIKSISNVQVNPGVPTKFDSCTTLEVDTTTVPPTPQGLSVVQNAAQGTLLLSWLGVPLPDLAGYAVYRGSLGNLEKIKALVTDTFFTDTVFNNPLTDTLPEAFSYQITAIDHGNHESYYSELVTIEVFPPCFYRCQFTWTVKNANGNDTVTNADSAVITVNYQNQKRLPLKFSWYVDNNQNEISSHFISATRDPVDSVSRGSDTFKYRWNTPGTKTVYIRSFDDQGDSWLDSFDLQILDSLTFHPKQTWISAPVMATKRKLATAAVLDSTIYVIGGCAMKSDGTKATLTALSSVEKYDLRNGTWTKVIDIPGKRYYAASTALNGKIYVFGGSGLSSIYSYKPGDGAWEPCGTLPYNLCGMSVCSYENKILIIGGMNDDFEATDVILSYDTSTKTVDTMGVLDAADGKRECHKSFIYKDNLYIIGGTEGTFGYSNVLVYNLKVGMVTGSFPMSHSRVNFAAWVKDNYLFIAGGSENLQQGAEMYNDGEYVDLNSSDKVWNSIQNLPKAVLGAASVTAGDGLYMIGGAKDNQFVPGEELESNSIYYP
jgi:N-acetylneuraminic acid mutarotase